MTVAAPPSERTRLHQPLGGVLVRVTLFLVIAGLDLWEAFSFSLPYRWALLALCVVLWALLLAVLWCPGITLTATQAIVHDFRPCRIAWTDVRAVTPEVRRGGVSIVLWTKDGRRIVLRAPTKEWGVRLDRFERDFITIGQWWLTHRDGA